MRHSDLALTLLLFVGGGDEESIGGSQLRAKAEAVALRLARLLGELVGDWNEVFCHQNVHERERCNKFDLIRPI